MGIQWVTGMKYKVDAELQQHNAAYAALKGALRQLAD